MTVSVLQQLKSLFHRSNDEPSATRRLDGRSKELLAASIRMTPYEESGWITLEEAAVLFSPAEDEHAFRAMDEGKRNLASFVTEETHHCRFEFIEGRVYFIRTASDVAEMRASFDAGAERQDRPRWSEVIRLMIDQCFKGALKRRRVVGPFSQRR